MKQSTRYDLLTSEACEALAWSIDRLPHGTFENFKEEAEEVLRELFDRYGVTPDVMTAFNVTALVADRQQYVDEVVRGDLFALNDYRYLISGHKFYRQHAKGHWVDCHLSEEYRARLRLVQRGYEIKKSQIS